MSLFLYAMATVVVSLCLWIVISSIVKIINPAGTFEMEQNQEDIANSPFGDDLPTISEIVDALRNHEDKIQHLKKYVSHHEHIISGKSRAVERLEGYVEAHVKKIERLEFKLAQKEGVIQRQAKALNQFETKVQDMSSLNECLTNRIATLESQVASGQVPSRKGINYHKIRKLQSNMDKVEADLQEVKTSNEVHAAKIDTQFKHLSDLENDARNLETAVKTVKLKVDAAKDLFINQGEQIYNQGEKQKELEDRIQSHNEKFVKNSLLEIKKVICYLKGVVARQEERQDRLEKDLNEVKEVESKKTGFFENVCSKEITQEDVAEEDSLGSSGSNQNSKQDQEINVNLDSASSANNANRAPEEDVKPGTSEETCKILETWAQKASVQEQDVACNDAVPCPAVLETAKTCERDPRPNVLNEESETTRTSTEKRWTKRVRKWLRKKFSRFN